MIWWLWVLFGIGMLFLELFLPSGFFIFFFGIGALVTSVVVSLYPDLEPSAQWAFCTVLSVILALVLRRFLMGKFLSPASFNNNPEGREVEVSEPADSGEAGACEYRGTRWAVRNVGTVPLNKGDRAVIERREGFTLLVRKV